MVPHLEHPELTVVVTPDCDQSMVEETNTTMLKIYSSVMRMHMFFIVFKRTFAGPKAF